MMGALTPRRRLCVLVALSAWCGRALVRTPAAPVGVVARAAALEEGGVPARRGERSPGSLCRRGALALGLLAASGPRPSVADPPKVSDRVAVPGVISPDELRAAEAATAKGRILKNGLKYVDGVVGAGAEPAWGQVLQIKYTAYARSAAGALTKVDSAATYLVRHGNGRTIRGLDEGIHTMRVGGTRRVEVPLQMGFTAPGLGPMPTGAGERRKLDKLLDALALEGPGTAIVYDVGLLDAWDDDADAGFYKDNSFSGKEIAYIVEQAQGIADRLK